MSDNDSDYEKHHPETKLSLGQLGDQTDSNPFNFRERIEQSSSSDQQNETLGVQVGQINNKTSHEQIQQKQTVQISNNQSVKVSLQKVQQTSSVALQDNRQSSQETQSHPKTIQSTNQNSEQKQNKLLSTQLSDLQKPKIITEDLSAQTQKTQQKYIQLPKKQQVSLNAQKKNKPSNTLANCKQQIFNLSEKKQKQTILTTTSTQQQSKKQQRPQQTTNKIQADNKQMTANKLNNLIELGTKIPKDQTKEQETNPIAVDNKKKQTGLAYDKEAQDDLAHLKQSLVKKKKNAQRQTQKAKMNKTMVPCLTKQLSFDETAETRAMQLKMITAMAHEKKKQNYQRLKQWDKRRAESLAIHRNMVQILQTQIDKRIKSSIENLQIYTTFLREKAKQEQRYAAHPVINTKYALQNNTISKNVYINCTVILNALSDQNNNRCKKIQDFVQVIRNDILRDSIETHLSQSQRQLLKIREKISAFKAALRKCNTETEQKTNQLVLFYNQNSVSIMETDKDFYATQLQFLSKAQQQTLIQKKLGGHCLQYFHTAMAQELKRSIVIRDAMITFSKALEQCYGIEADPAQIQQLSKAQQNKLIQQFYSLEQIFDQRCLTLFKSYEHISPSKTLNIEMFSTFLNKFDFQGFDSRIVLLKQYQTQFHSTSKPIINLTQSCYLVITVDKWIHLFFDKQKTAVYTKPDVSIKATLKNLQLRPIKNQIVDLVIKEQKRNSMIIYFWESKNQRVYRVQFIKKDNREQFMDYVRKLRG